MSVIVKDENGEFVAELDKQAFREKFYKDEDERRKIRATKAEQKVRAEMIEKSKTVLKPVLGKSEKDTEKRKLQTMIYAGFTAEGVTITPTGKTGEYAVRMPLMDYTIKITSKKDRMELLD